MTAINGITFCFDTMTAKTKHGSLNETLETRWNEKQGCMEYWLSTKQGWDTEYGEMWLPVFSEGREARDKLNQAYAGYILEKDVLKC